MNVPRGMLICLLVTERAPRCVVPRGQSQMGDHKCLTDTIHCQAFRVRRSVVSASPRFREHFIEGAIPRKARFPPIIPTSRRSPEEAPEPQRGSVDKSPPVVVAGLSRTDNRREPPSSQGKKNLFLKRGLTKQRPCAHGRAVLAQYLAAGCWIFLARRRLAR